MKFLGKKNFFTKKHFHIQIAHQKLLGKTYLSNSFWTKIDQYITENVFYHFGQKCFWFNVVILSFVVRVSLIVRVRVRTTFNGLNNFISLDCNVMYLLFGCYLFTVFKQWTKIVRTVKEGLRLLTLTRLK